MYQLLPQQDPCVKTTTYLLLLQPNHWKHGGNPGRPPTQGQDSTTAVQPFRNFGPNFLSLLFLTFFAAIQDTGHHGQCLLLHFLNLSSWTSWPTNHLHSTKSSAMFPAWTSSLWGTRPWVSRSSFSSMMWAAMCLFSVLLCVCLWYELYTCCTVLSAWACASLSYCLCSLPLRTMYTLYPEQEQGGSELKSRPG